MKLVRSPSRYSEVQCNRGFYLCPSVTEDEYNTFPHNFGNGIPNDAASFHGRTEFSATRQWNLTTPVYGAIMMVVVAASGSSTTEEKLKLWPVRVNEAGKVDERGHLHVTQTQLLVAFVKLKPSHIFQELYMTLLFGCKFRRAKISRCFNGRLLCFSFCNRFDSRLCLSEVSIKRLSNFFFVLALQPPLGVVFYSPLAGFSLLAYEVSWSHTTTRHIR